MNDNEQQTIVTDWKNENGQSTYYQDGKPLNGRQYVNLPTIPNTNVQWNTNWYLMDNGIAQSGVQQWADTYYYFDPRAYLRVDNDYRGFGICSVTMAALLLKFTNGLARITTLIRILICK
ncbi:hypothetical protein [Limosilactobacillus reuteri]|uniref:hypothetical protein n=1 Tax=Limosilactobacillus reuteri TaxID=1598 RepID=UPI000A31F79E